MRSILGLVYTVNALDSMGLEPHAILARHGLDLKNIDPGARIDKTQEASILSDLIKPLRNPHVALNMGAHFGLAGYGPFSMLLMTCDNAFEACKMAIHYQQITYLFHEIELVLDKEKSTILFKADHAVADKLGKFLIDKDIAGTVKLAQDIAQSVGLSITLQKVGFPYAKPAKTELHQRGFNCPVLFDQPNGYMVFDATDLVKPFPQANKTAFALYKSQCDALLKLDAGDKEPMAESIRKHLQLFVYEYPSITKVAKTFNTTERTLRRRLSEENTSFQKIIDHIKQTKACSLLADTLMSIEEIAHKLGYRETASFNHAFNRWTGQTPSGYRKQHGNTQ